MALGDKFSGLVSSSFSDYLLEKYKAAKEAKAFDKHLIAMYDPKFRRARDINVADDPYIYNTVQSIFHQANQQFYNFDISSKIEIWIMEYTEASAGYVDWHMDFEGKSLHNNDVGEQIKLAMSLGLTDDYTGGELEFDEGIIQLKKDNFVVFPSMFRHRVQPVKQGTRVSMVAWQYGPNWK